MQTDDLRGPFLSRNKLHIKIIIWVMQIMCYREFYSPLRLFVT